MKPCKKCERGIHDEQLDANGGYCSDCKPIDGKKPVVKEPEKG
jgi:hypothetical protein